MPISFRRVSDIQAFLPSDSEIRNLKRPNILRSRTSPLTPLRLPDFVPDRQLAGYPIFQPCAHPPAPRSPNRAADRALQGEISTSIRSACCAVPLSWGLWVPLLPCEMQCLH